MSRNEMETGREADLDFSALDLELKQMAEETPEVPADFHARWTQAVREEAETGRREEAPAEEDRTEQRKADARRQRRYLISAAAAFIMVIGIAIVLQKTPGGLFTEVKNTSAPVTTEQPADSPGLTDGAEQTVSVSETNAAGEAAAEESVVAETTDSAVSGDAGEVPAIVGSAAKTRDDTGKEASKTAALTAEEAEESYESEEGYPEEAQYAAGIAGSGDTGGASAAEEEAPAPATLTANAGADLVFYDMAQDAEAEAEEDLPDDGTWYEAAEASMPATTAAPTPAPTAEPTPAPAAEPTAEPDAETEGQEAAAAAAASTEKTAKQETAPEQAETPEEESSPSFLQRLWDLILLITPWVLGVMVVVLFLVTYVIRIKQRKRK